MSEHPLTSFLIEPSRTKASATPDGRRTYRFESVLNRKATFFFDAGELVLVGDHTTFPVRDA